MNHYEKLRILRSTRGAALQALGNSMIVGADHLVGKSELRAAIEEIYPGDAAIDFRGKLYEKLVKVAEGAQDRRNRFQLRQVVDQLVIQVEQKLASDERIVPVPEEEEPIDMDAIMEKTDRFSDMVGGDLARQHDKEVAEAQAIVRKARG